MAVSLRAFLFEDSYREALSPSTVERLERVVQILEAAGIVTLTDLMAPTNIVSLRNEAALPLGARNRLLHHISQTVLFPQTQACHVGARFLKDEELLPTLSSELQAIKLKDSTTVLAPEEYLVNPLKIKLGNFLEAQMGIEGNTMKKHMLVWAALNGDEGKGFAPGVHAELSADVSTFPPKPSDWENNHILKVCGQIQKFTFQHICSTAQSSKLIDTYRAVCHPDITDAVHGLLKDLPFRNVLFIEGLAQPYEADIVGGNIVWKYADAPDGPQTSENRYLQRKCMWEDNPAWRLPQPPPNATEQLKAGAPITLAAGTPAKPLKLIVLVIERLQQSQSFRMFVGPKVKGTIQHSSFTRGKDCIFAGYVSIVDGKIKYLLSSSGHYRPGVQHLTWMDVFLSAHKVPFPERMTTFFVKPPEDPNEAADERWSEAYLKLVAAIKKLPSSAHGGVQLV
mmetsp:Transcript_31773/g.79702  ORF Transcript_31773/g.79702 Transcript_31773/m.79702 type:complete len:453 (-) Transcript_31773:38-1396(-)